MGKHTHKKRPHICIPSGHPGCVWGLILHGVKYPDWHYVKKRLPCRKHGGDKQAAGDDNPRNKKISNADELQETSNDEVNNSHVQEVRQGTTTNKISIKALIKSLVNEEFSKRKKSQHHRISTYPVRAQLTRTNSIHHLKAPQGNFLVETTSTDEIPKTATKSNEHSNTTSSADSLLEKSFEVPIANGETGEYFQVDENERQLIENCTLLQENFEDERQASLDQSLIISKDVTTDASLHRSKEFLDALDMIDMNKEFFLKIMHDPSSPTAHHFHNQQTFNTRMGLNKSESFSLPDFSGRRVPGPRKLKNKQDLNRSCEKEEVVCKQSLPLTVVEDSEDGIQNVNQAPGDIADSSSSGSAHHFNNPGRNEVVINRFKDLKKKIKHAIKESRNERHRITIDAILHKIPHNQGFSKDLNNKILDQLKDSSILSDSKDSLSSSDHTALIGKRRRHMRRTSSLNETLDRYCQLYESTFNREAKQPISERLKLRREEEASPSRDTAKSLGRIYSLPEIKSYYYQNEDFSDVYSSWMPVRVPVEETGSTSSVGEQNSSYISMASEYFSQLDNSVESQFPENLVVVHETDFCTGDQLGSTLVADSIIEVDKLSDDLITLTTMDSASDGEWDIEAKATEPSPVTVFDFNSQDVGESTVEFSFSEESEVMLEFLIPDVHDSLTGHHLDCSLDAPLVAHSSDFEKLENLPHVQVDEKDKAKFDYVKNILEMTGFSGNESLGTWYSDDQPVDPSVYEEVGGCILLDPECSGNEGGSCNHMFFFDLINEVLIEIYERSYSYYPKPLSSQCHIPQMPAGNRVLKEVWRNISGYLSLGPELDQSLDYIASRDLSKNDGWMNLQFNSECVAREVEDLIFNELLEELICS